MMLTAVDRITVVLLFALLGWGIHSVSIQVAHVETTLQARDACLIAVQWAPPAEDSEPEKTPRPSPPPPGR